MSYLRIQKATGRAGCRLCERLIEKDTFEMVGNLGTGNYEGHYHLEATKLDVSPHLCRGILGQIWHPFIRPLLDILTDPMGNDFDEMMRMIINMWEQEEFENDCDVS